MTKITEDAVEHIAIKLLEEQGYSYIYGPTIAPDGENPQIKWDANLFFQVETIYINVRV